MCFFIGLNPPKKTHCNISFKTKNEPEMECYVMLKFGIVFLRLMYNEKHDGNYIIELRSITLLSL